MASYVHWTKEMDEALISTFIDYTNFVSRNGLSFSLISACIEIINQNFQVEVAKRGVKAHFRILINQFKLSKEIIQTDRFHWDNI